MDEDWIPESVSRGWNQFASMGKQRRGFGVQLRKLQKLQEKEKMLE